MKDMMLKIGSWAFLLGILIALIVGLVHASSYEAFKNEEDLDKKADLQEKIFFSTDTGSTVAWVLVVLGAIVGALAILGKGTITARETPGFLLAGISLLVMGGVFTTITNSYSLTPWIGSLLLGISLSLSIFVAPAVGILAMKAIWDMGKDV